MRSTILALIACVLLPAAAAVAATFTPQFDQPSFPGRQYDVGARENSVYKDLFGIRVTNSYLYLDSKDTFDGIGIANGNVSEIGTRQAGRISFLEPTTFVTVDFWSLRKGAYVAFDVEGRRIDRFTTARGQIGTDTLSGGLISSILFKGRAGYVTISGLTYAYEDRLKRAGTLPAAPPPAVPLPAGLALMLSGLGILAVCRRG